MHLIQAYAPTADTDEEQHDNFYERLEELVRRQRGYVVVMGDFNARVGSRKHGEVFVGPHSAKEGNGLGERLASFCELHNLYHGNSQFLKAPQKRWTHIPPNGQHCHEIDHVRSSICLREGANWRKEKEFSGNESWNLGLAYTQFHWFPMVTYRLEFVIELG
ncbi:unnamed protein product [Haemonchus placei]|uniref:Endo/exonuclease/phosphatase domain-containing protein n=1 Tax=Haemonchus placei TaxID=6290 RepID=A0A0N4X0P6_HAEPC|nr:unnamed protein product [Haemonchus placei]